MIPPTQKPYISPTVATDETAPLTLKSSEDNSHPFDRAVATYYHKFNEVPDLDGVTEANMEAAATALNAAVKAGRKLTDEEFIAAMDSTDIDFPE